MLTQDYYRQIFFVHRNSHKEFRANFVGSLFHFSAFYCQNLHIYVCRYIPVPYALYDSFPLVHGIHAYIGCKKLGHAVCLVLKARIQTICHPEEDISCCNHSLGFVHCVYGYVLVSGAILSFSSVFSPFFNMFRI